MRMLSLSSPQSGKKNRRALTRKKKERKLTSNLKSLKMLFFSTAMQHHRDTGVTAPSGT